MNNMKDFNKNKKVGIIKNVIRVIFIVMIVAFLLMVCLQRFSGNKVSLFNFRMFTVVSGSMEPKYKIGDVLIAREVKASKVKKGDTISYLGTKGDVNGKVITHEVIGIKKDSNGNFVFQTQGLANPIADIYPVYENQLYGVVIYKVFILSFVYKIVGTTYGLFLFVILPLLYIIGSEFVELLLDKEAKRREKLK